MKKKEIIEKMNKILNKTGYTWSFVAELIGVPSEYLESQKKEYRFSKEIEEKLIEIINAN